MALPRCDTWPHAVKTPTRVRNLYDAQLRLDSGKEYFAGRPINDIKNSLDYVLSFPDELEQLGAAIQANPMRREMLLYNHIAWLESKVGSRHSDQIEHTGDYMSDSAEAGDSDRAAGVNHDGDARRDYRTRRRPTMQRNSVITFLKLKHRILVKNGCVAR